MRKKSEEAVRRLTATVAAADAMPQPNAFTRIGPGDYVSRDLIEDIRTVLAELAAHREIKPRSAERFDAQLRAPPREDP